MPFVKLDTRILDSTLWMDRDSREIFITALLMAEPRELRDPMQQIEVRTLNFTGWNVPAGWYGLAPVAGIGIVNRARLDQVSGMVALEKLCSPDIESRSHDFDGRRLARIDGGYVVLNYMRFRERDETSAERSKRYRERRGASHRDVTGVTRDKRDATRDGVTDTVRHTVTGRDITHADAEVDAEAEEDQDRNKRAHTLAATQSVTPATHRDAVKQGNGVAPASPPLARAPVVAADPDVADVPFWWERFKAAMPKRAGSQPWLRAVKAAHARIEEGATADQFIGGAERYADYCDATGKTGTELVLQAATFLGPEKHYLEPWDLPGTSRPPTQYLRTADELEEEARTKGIAPEDQL